MKSEGESVEASATKTVVCSTREDALIECCYERENEGRRPVTGGGRSSTDSEASRFERSRHLKSAMSVLLPLSLHRT